MLLRQFLSLKRAASTLSVRKQVLGHLRSASDFNEQSLTNLIVGFVRVQDWQVASQLLEKVAWPNIPGYDRDDELTVYLVSEWLQASPDECLNNAVKILKARKSALLLDTLLTAAQDRAHLPCVDAIVEIMKKDSFKLSQSRLEDLIVSVYLPHAQWSRIAHVLQWMRERGEHPSVALWERIFAVCLQPGIGSQEEVNVAFSPITWHSQARFPRLQSLLQSWKDLGVLRGRGEAISEAMKSVLQKWMPSQSFIRFLSQL